MDLAGKISYALGYLLGLMLLVALILGAAAAIVALLDFLF